MAEEVLKRHPDVRFGTLAYRETHMAPDFQINPAIVVYLCFDFGCAQYPDVRKRLNAWIGEWAKTGATLGVWEYGFGDSYYTLPRVGFRNQAEIFRLLADNGFRAFFGEGAESLADGPKRYLYMKLMEEPRADIDKLTKLAFTTPSLGFLLSLAPNKADAEAVRRIYSDSMTPLNA